jgi:hypothetical protein
VFQCIAVELFVTIEIDHLVETSLTNLANVPVILQFSNKIKMLLLVFVRIVVMGDFHCSVC